MAFMHSAVSSLINTWMGQKHASSIVLCQRFWMYFFQARLNCPHCHEERQSETPHDSYLHRLTLRHPHIRLHTMGSAVNREASRVAWGNPLCDISLLPSISEYRFLFSHLAVSSHTIFTGACSFQLTLCREYKDKNGFAHQFKGLIKSYRATSPSLTTSVTEQFEVHDSLIM